ncbi:MAG: hypothetical protein GX442_06070 [Candidatus Riflebacteria bacterium]|nr:hypothetical protein [Candidatus Riflebacteria bacterium]
MGLLAALVLLLVFAGPGRRVAAQVMAGQTVETDEYVLFLPPELGMDFRRPLLVAFSPDADAAGMVALWQGAARRHQCLVLASKVVKNGLDVPPVLSRLLGEIPRLSRRFPIDLRFVIATGVSGGSMTAHLAAFLFPEVVAGVIANIGLIHKNSLRKVERYPRDKVAVFLTGPEDYDYRAMRNDRKFLDRLGWRTHLLEYPGGHVAAPPEVLDEALSWVLLHLGASDPARATAPDTGRPPATAP